MRVIITALNLKGKNALQKHLDSKLNPAQKLLKKRLFSEQIIYEPYFQIIIGFKEEALFLVSKIDYFIYEIKEALKENGASEEDYKIEVLE